MNVIDRVLQFPMIAWPHSRSRRAVRAVAADFTRLQPAQRIALAGWALILGSVSHAVLAWQLGDLGSRSVIGLWTAATIAGLALLGGAGRIVALRGRLIPSRRRI